MNIPPLISRSPPPLDDDAEDEEDDEDEFRNMNDRMDGVLTDHEVSKPDFLFKKTNCVAPESVTSGDIIFESQLTKKWESNIPPNDSLSPDSSVNNFTEVFKLSVRTSKENLVQTDEDSKHSIFSSSNVSEDFNVDNEVTRISSANDFHSEYVPSNCMDFSGDDPSACISCPDESDLEGVHCKNSSSSIPENTSLSHNGTDASGTSPASKDVHVGESAQSVDCASPDITDNIKEVFPNEDELHPEISLDYHNDNLQGPELSQNTENDTNDGLIAHSSSSEFKQDSSNLENSDALPLDFDQLHEPSSSVITSDIPLDCINEVTVDCASEPQNVSSTVNTHDSSIEFRDLQSAVTCDSSEENAHQIIDSLSNDPVENINLEESSSSNPPISTHTCDAAVQEVSLRENITRQINLETDSDNDSFDDFVSFHPSASVLKPSENISDPLPSSSNARTSQVTEAPLSDEFGDYKQEISTDEFTDFTWFDATTVTNSCNSEVQSTTTEEPFSDVDTKDVLPLCLNEALKSNNVWWTLSNFDSTPALSYKWTASTANRKLLRALKIDSRNILAAPWNRSVSSKGMISYDGKYMGSESECPNNSSENKAVVPQPHFDWIGSGLVNPLDVNQRVHFPQTKGNVLSYEAASFLQTLPDLSYMHQRSFVFPKKIK